MTPGNSTHHFPGFPAKFPLGQPGLNGAERAAEERFLASVQGNILKGHGRGWQRLLFMRFTRDAAASRQFLQQLVQLRVEPHKKWHWITTALEQQQQRMGWHQAYKSGLLKTTLSLQKQMQSPTLLKEKDSGSSPFEIFGGIMLTRDGLEHLEVPLTGPLDTPSFKVGMKWRMGSRTQDEMVAEPYDWESDPAKACHFVFLLACDDPPDSEGRQTCLDAHQGQLLSWCRDHGADLCASEDSIQSAFAWRDESRPYGNDYLPPREPFGFVDGISQPRFFSEDRHSSPARPGTPTAHHWTDLRLDQVLIKDEGSHEGGAFVTLLKIEQNVQAFRAYEHEVFKWLRAKFPNQLTDEQAAYLAPALLMGRTRHGYPLGEILGQLAAHEPALWDTLLQGEADAQRDTPADRPPQAPAWLNEFDFNQQGGPAPAPALPGARGCPFHVHARKMNPREDHNASGHGSKDHIVAAQPVRRGAVFGSEADLRACELKDRQRKPSDPPVNGWPSAGTGLMFLAYMRDLAGQFELLHSHWARWTYFPADKSGVDPVLAHPVHHPSAPLRFGGQALPNQPAALAVPFVRRLGGFYLYAPSIPWLNRGGKD